jgi:hypothetical protein
VSSGVRCLLLSSCFVSSTCLGSAIKH